MKKLYSLFAVVLFFCSVPVFAATSISGFSVDYDTDSFDESACFYRLKVTANFNYDDLNCKSFSSCDSATGAFTLTGLGSPYTVVSTQSSTTTLGSACSAYPTHIATETLTKIYKVPPSASIKVDAKISQMCGGVTQYYATAVTHFTTQSLDEDGDGYSLCGSQDCNDQDAAVHPGAVEYCDGIDNDCDGQTDNVADADGDGVSVCSDCDDNDPLKKPGLDRDNDGTDSCTDCNDDPDTGALAQILGTTISGDVTILGAEVANQKDDSCNGKVDENVDNEDCKFCELGTVEPVNFMSGAATTLPQRDFLLKGINGLDLDFYRTYSNQAREELTGTLKTMVRGTASDPNILTVEVNGSPTAVINGIWQKEVTLSAGSNTITATAELEGVALEDSVEVDAVSTSKFSLGPGWTHVFNLFLRTESGGIVVVQDPNGRDVSFYPDGQGNYIELNGISSDLEPIIGGGFRWIKGDGKTYTFNAGGFLTRISDRFSNVVTLTYASNRLATITDTVGREITLTYSSGKLTQIDDGTNTLAAYTYDTNGNLATATNSAGEVTTYVYSDSNDLHNLTGIQNNDSQVILSLEYDSHDRTVSIAGGESANGLDISYDSPGQTTITTFENNTTTYQYAYDPVNESGSITTTGPGCSICTSQGIVAATYGPNYTLTSATDRNGNITTYTYDSRGNVLTRTEAYGTGRERTTTYTYHPYFNFELTETVQSVLDSGEVRKITYDYDDDLDSTPNESPGLSIRQQIVEGITKNSSGSEVPFQQVTYFSYDNLGRLTAIDGPRTDVTDTTTLTYYSIVSEDPKSGLLESITRTDGTTSLVTTYDDYDVRGNVLQITDPNNQVTAYTYDNMNRVLTLTQGGDTTTYAYDADGNIHLIHLPNGNDIGYTYDRANRLIQITDDPGNKIIYEYDTQGNRTREERRDPSNTLKTYLDMEYISLNLLHLATHPDSTFTQHGYDSAGNRTSLRDPNENMTEYDYDELNRLTHTTQPGSVDTSLSYDSQDHLTGVTDDNSNATTYEYDDAGRLVTLTSPDTGTTHYAYDDAGNLVYKKDANNIVTTYEYDFLNRLTYIHFPDSSQDITYSYDGATSNGLGRLTGMTDPSGTTTYSYTSKGQIYEEVKTVTGLSGSFTTTYSYDANGNLTGITYPSGRQVTYTLDSADRLTQVSGSHGGPSTTYATISNYLPYGPYQSISLGNGLSTTLTYDNRYQFDGQTVGSSPQLLSHDYTHDANGNVTAISDLINSAKNKTYGYDALDRLTAATGPWPSSGNLSYTYDSVGNRLTEGGSLGSSTYSYSDNLLTDITGAKTKTFAYDANGNAVTENNRAYVYDQNNRLVQVTENSSTLGTYTYDGQGRRVKKVASGQTTYFLYDLQSRLLAEADASGVVTTEYLWLPDRPLAKIDIAGSTENVVYYHTDHLGTPLFLTDSTGQKVWSAELLPFGEGYDINEDVDGDQVHVVNNLRFLGQYYDAETGLHYNVMRDYNPQIGRYIESDPMGLGSGINTFAYVGGNPLYWIDPSGLLWIYEQSSGNLYHQPDSGGGGPPQLMGTGYAGSKDKGGLNNPAKQYEKDVGPIPQGLYTIGAQGDYTTSEGKILSGAMTLTPQPGTYLGKRTGGFLIHGGDMVNKNSSTGCIIADRNIRNKIGSSGDTTLQVVQ